MSEPRAAGSAKQVRLQQVSLPRLLFALLRKRFTGQLHLRQAPLPGDDAASRRTVWFRGGMPVFTDWASPELVLGQVMLRDRLIDDAQLRVALQVMAQESKLLGETLIAQALADRRTVLEGLRRQCAAKLRELFALRRGTVWVAADDDRLDADLLAVNVLELIAAGVSTHYDAERIRAEMGSALEERLGASTAFQRYRAHFGFRDDDARAIDALCKGGIRLERLDGMASSPERALRLVYVLWACQMLEMGAPATTSPRAVERPRPSERAPANPAPAPPQRQARSEPVGTSVSAASTTKPTRSEDPQPTRAQEGTASSDDDFTKELAALEAKIEADANPFELLGVPLTAGKKEIRRAFSDRSRTFHPDGLQAKGLGHLRDRVSAAFAALSEAQMLLNDKTKREELRQAIERGEDPKKSKGNDAAAMARAAFESEVIAKDADKLLRAGRFDRALEHYERAVALTPDEADYQAAIAWCRYNLAGKSTAQAANAETELARILEANPKLARAHYFRGLVLITLEREDEAIVALTQAHRCDSRLIDAERQARVLRMKKTGSAGSPGRDKASTGTARFGFKSLFGKK